MIDNLVSICIPTFKRPDLLGLALQSCFAQTYRPLEIVVGDDSPDDETERSIEGLDVPGGCTLVYRHHRTNLGQNENVNALFDLASGARLVLLHDDDLLLPDAVESLVRAWRDMPEFVMSFGKAEMMAADATPLPLESIEVDRKYSRVAPRAGVTPSLLEAALLQIVPNNGYMIRTDVARAIRFRDEETIGVYCDTDFSIRVGLAHDAHAGAFIDRYLSRYRYTAEAISVGREAKVFAHPRAGLALYRFVRSLAVPPQIAAAKRFQLRHQADKAVKELAYRQRRFEALGVYFSKDYPWRARLSAKGAYHLALIAVPYLDALRSYSRSGVRRTKTS